MLSEKGWAIAAKFDAGRHHPLICHMIDVASVVEAVWDSRLSERERELIANGLGLPEREARQWAAFVAGLHDLGKATRVFSGRDPEARERLKPFGLSPSVKVDPGHGKVTAASLPGLLRSTGVVPRMSARLATVAGGHHGRFLQNDNVTVAIDEERDAVREQWQAIRKDLFDALRDALEIGPPPSGDLPNAAAMLLAGIVSVCDWIGSDTNYFRFYEGNSDDLPEYLSRARQHAREALDAIHWTSLVPDDSRPGMKELFGDGREPRPLQDIAEKFEATSEPGLIIVEAPTGEGKTEAALLFADRWNTAGFAGQYIALPTQATANQMYRRVNAYLGRRYGGHEIVDMLVHGGAWMNDDLVIVPSGVAGDDVDSAVVAAEWFLNRKRTLLAPFGVGTIDQALFAVLQVKHVFVRLFGLAGKVIVLDEVHAYDTYMTGLIERLLNWLGALGSPVVLLSATLPTSRRQMLIDAYNAGLHVGPQPALELPEAAYPRMTKLVNGQLTADTVPASARSIRTLGIGRVKGDDDHEAVAQLLETELVEGGCAAVICNTVGRAQETYLALRERLDCEVSLFHARFVAEDRERIEKQCLNRFGPPDDAEVDRPSRHVLVATQVVEQSLDLDFDVMVTDLAPVDLLLQRAGRLQRHDRGPRRQPLSLHVLWPRKGDDGIPQFDRGSAAVYDPHILLRTWWELKKLTAIGIPGDVQRLVDAVYDESGDAPEGVSAQVAGFWAESWEEMEGKRLKEQSEAEVRALRRPWNSGALTEFLRDPKEEESPELHPALQALTRLAGPSIGLVILGPDDPAAGVQTRPGRDEIRRLVGRSVTVAQPGLVSALSGLEPPKEWAEIPALRSHPLLVVDSERNRDAPGYAIGYDRELGFVATRETSQ